jgi:predicted dehydrogenase
MTAHGVLVVGCGGWGRRVASKLREAGLRVVTVDPHPDAHADHWTVVEALAKESQPLPFAVVAVPPSMQQRVALEIIAHNRALTDLRLEKPGCASLAELEQLDSIASHAGVQVSVGYTLAAHPVHQWAWERAMDAGGVTRVAAARTTQAKARHAVSALHDLGSHAVFCAWHVGGLQVAREMELTAAHSSGLEQRITWYSLPDESTIRVCETWNVAMHYGRTGEERDRFYCENADPLRVELDAFVQGAPLVEAGVGIWVHHAMQAHADHDSGHADHDSGHADHDKSEVVA